ncbi:MAG: ECF transporter S component [Chloroflexi bacterium]|nr:ECF transporter S component [Chloroflexota bacterium]
MKTRLITVTAVMAALITVTTRVVQIPTPVTQGYLNAGDILVILAGFILGPRMGFIAGGMGSMIADIMTAYPFFYITLIVKGAEGAIPGFSWWRFNPRISRSANILRLLFSSIIAAFVMAGGYFLFQWKVFGWVAAAAGLVPNMFQGALGITGTLLIYSALDPYLRRWDL